jgi:hypothetical protein
LSRPLPGVDPQTDLTVRAARLLQAETGCRRGVRISVEKRLPMGGGLGGGSSDAATVLLALNHLWQLGLPRRRLQEIGLSLGADVPVFVFGRSAFAEGVGEALRPVVVPPACYVVLEPPVQVPTATIFGSAKLKRDTAPIHADTWKPGFGGSRGLGRRGCPARGPAFLRNFPGQTKRPRFFGSFPPACAAGWRPVLIAIRCSAWPTDRRPAARAARAGSARPFRTTPCTGRRSRCIGCRRTRLLRASSFP